MHGPVKKLYIITTAHKRDTGEWEEEFAPFLLCTEKEGTPYDPVTIDSWNNIGKYADVKDAFFIFDEQRVVGYGAWTKAFLRIAKANQWILLSATPGDKWIDYLPVFIANGFFKTKTQFNNEHVVWAPYVKFPKILRYTNEARLVKMRNSILVDMRVERDTVPHHEMIYTDYDRALYKSMVEDRWNPYTNAPFLSASDLCYALRKVCNTDASRHKALLDIMRTHNRIVVFYNFTYERDALANYEYDSDIVVAEWNGQKHEPVPTGKRWLYLVQYTAGAEGWNCTSTDTIVFYSPNYSYRTLTQACGRIDRRNTKYHDLYYYHLYTKSPIDNSILMAQKKKKKFNESAFADKLWNRVVPPPPKDPVDPFKTRYMPSNGRAA